MKTQIVVFFFMFTLVAFAQTEGKGDIPPLKGLKTNPFDNERLNSYLQLDKPTNEGHFNYDIGYKPLDLSGENLYKLEMPPIKHYTYPVINMNPINTHYPFANDYTMSASYRLSNKAWMNTLSTNNAYPTLGTVRNVSAQFGYQLTDWMSVSASPYAAKYSIYNTHYNDFGIGGNLKLKISDDVKFNLYGKYSANGKRNNIGGPMTDMYPASNYGGSIEFKISEKFGVEAGMLRELNPFNGKWENRPFIAPKFYK